LVKQYLPSSKLKFSKKQKHCNCKYCFVKCTLISPKSPIRFCRDLLLKGLCPLGKEDPEISKKDFLKSSFLGNEVIAFERKTFLSKVKKGQRFNGISTKHTVKHLQLKNGRRLILTP